MIPLAGGVGPRGCLNLTEPDTHLATTSAPTIASVFVLGPHWDSPSCEVANLVTNASPFPSSQVVETFVIFSGHST